MKSELILDTENTESSEWKEWIMEVFGAFWAMLVQNGSDFWQFQSRWCGTFSLQEILKDFTLLGVKLETFLSNDIKEMAS